MAYLTQADIEARLGTDLTTEQLAYFVGILLPGIEAVINEKTGTVFESEEEVSVYVDGNCTKSLIIPTMSEVTSVHSIDSADNETLVPETSYTKFPRSGSILALRNKTGTWSEGFENYKVTGKLGYSDVPGDIKAVALEMAVNSLSSNPGSDIKAEKVGDYSVTYKDSSASSSISVMSESVLARYNRISRSV